MIGGFSATVDFGEIRKCTSQAEQNTPLDIFIYRISKPQL